VTSKTVDAVMKAEQKCATSSTRSIDKNGDGHLGGVCS